MFLFWRVMHWDHLFCLADIHCVLLKHLCHLCGCSSSFGFPIHTPAASYFYAFVNFWPGGIHEGKMWSNLLCWISAKAKMAFHDVWLMADQVWKTAPVHASHVLWKTRFCWATVLDGIVIKRLWELLVVLMLKILIDWFNMTEQNSLLFPLIF